MKKKTIISAVAAASLCIGALLPFPGAAAATYKMGDVNASGSVTAEDARVVLRSAVKLQTLSAAAAKRADVDFNGVVNEADSRMILQSVVGLQKLSEPHSHKYTAIEQKSADGKITNYHYRVCECGERKQEKHTFKTIVQTEATCTKTGLAYDKCTVCGLQTAIRTTDAQHKYEIVSVTPETCTENGSRNKKCSVCGKTAAEIIPMSHQAGPAATCSAPQKCERCGKELAPALGHIYPDTVDLELTHGLTCSRCEKVVIPSFNTLVNKLKDGSHHFTKIEASVSTFNEPKFTGIMKDVKFLFENEFKDQIGTTTEYSPVERNRLLTKDNFSVVGSEKVSELKEADVNDLTTKRIRGIDFVANLPSVIKTTTGAEYDISDLKSVTPGYVLKVTVPVKPEKYSELKDKGGVDKINRIYSGYDEIIASVQNELGSFGEEEEALGMRLEGDILSTATVTYYFDASTYEPIAAYYKIKMDMDQAMSLYESPTDTSPAGAIKFNIVTDMLTYYFFDGYFK